MSDELIKLDYEPRERTRPLAHAVSRFLLGWIEGAFNFSAAHPLASVSFVAVMVVLIVNGIAGIAFVLIGGLLLELLFVCLPLIGIMWFFDKLNGRPR